MGILQAHVLYLLNQTHLKDKESGKES